MVVMIASMMTMMVVIASMMSMMVWSGSMLTMRVVIASMMTMSMVIRATCSFASRGSDFGILLPMAEGRREGTLREPA